MKKVSKVSGLALATVTGALTLGLTGFIRTNPIINLGSADSFAVLAGSKIANTGTSVVSGDLGSSSEAATGFQPDKANDKNQASLAMAAAAQIDLTAAYDDAAGRMPVTTAYSELGGTTKTAGVYNSTGGSFILTGMLTLDARDNPNAVFIFRTATSLTTAPASIIKLINGARACNVFWQVGSSVTLGINSVFKGNILAFSSVTLMKGVNVEGRVLARMGGVSLNANTINEATCTDTNTKTAANTISVVAP